MNDLNSVLIEGKVTAIRAGDFGAQLEIASNRTYRNGQDNLNTETSSFLINIQPGKLAETCTTLLETGRKIRVVGRLRSQTLPTTTVEAEHVEIKPKPKAT